MDKSGAPVRPFMYRLLVQLLPTVDRIGSVILPQTTQDAQRALAMIARVVAVGPAAFEHDKFSGDRVSVGDYVLINKYKGAEFEVVDGREPPYRMINDDEILGVVEDPAKIKKAVCYARDPRVHVAGRDRGRSFGRRAGRRERDDRLPRRRARA